MICAQDADCMHELSDRPRLVRKILNMLTRTPPRLVSKDSVEFSQLCQFLWNMFEALKPSRIPTAHQELHLLLPNKIGATVPRSSHNRNVVTPRNFHWSVRPHQYVDGLQVAFQVLWKPSHESFHMRKHTARGNKQVFQQLLPIFTFHSRQHRIVAVVKPGRRCVHLRNGQTLLSRNLDNIREPRLNVSKRALRCYSGDCWQVLSQAFQFLFSSFGIILLIC
mmetsp:Transcript_30714/g.70805  ORF Transcript_30714/g.70805 Transcript_30714/m.70805 type:complete len:222 (-) Transcript_30714:218-883(-)